MKLFPGTLVSNQLDSFIKYFISTNSNFKKMFILLLLQIYSEH